MLFNLIFIKFFKYRFFNAFFFFFKFLILNWRVLMILFIIIFKLSIFIERWVHVILLVFQQITIEIRYYEWRLGIRVLYFFISFFICELVVLQTYWVYLIYLSGLLDLMLLVLIADIVAHLRDIVWIVAPSIHLASLTWQGILWILLYFSVLSFSLRLFQLNRVHSFLRAVRTEWLISLLNFVLLQCIFYIFSFNAA
jgi:hypothetical protein